MCEHGDPRESRTGGPWLRVETESLACDRTKTWTNWTRPRFGIKTVEKQGEAGVSRRQPRLPMLDDPLLLLPPKHAERSRDI